MKTEEAILTTWVGADLNDLYIPMGQNAHNEITILIVDKNGNHYFELSAEKMSITDNDDNADNFGLFVKTFKYYPQLLNEKIYSEAFKNFMNFAKSGMCITDSGNFAYYQYIWAKFSSTEEEKPKIVEILRLTPIIDNQDTESTIYKKRIIRYYN